MKYCKDCRKPVRDFELYCPRCSSDLYARRRKVRTGFLENLYHFQLRVS